MNLAEVDELLRKAQEAGEDMPVLYAAPDQELPDFDILAVKVHRTMLLSPGVIVVVSAAGNPLVVRNLGQEAA